MWLLSFVLTRVCCPNTGCVFKDTFVLNKPPVTHPFTKTWFKFPRASSVVIVCDINRVACAMLEFYVPELYRSPACTLSLPEMKVLDTASVMAFVNTLS